MAACEVPNKKTKLNSRSGGNSLKCSTSLVESSKSNPTEENTKIYRSCVLHSEDLTLFCADCKVFLCSRGLTSEHFNHKFIHVSDHIESAMNDLDEELRIKQEKLQNIVANVEISVNSKLDNKMKASNLRKQIRERCDHFKRIFDSVAREDDDEVSENWKRCEQEADDNLLELKNMEIIVTREIQSLNERKKNLNCFNVTEIIASVEDGSEIIPKYSKCFDLKLHFDEIEPIIHLRKIFGTLDQDQDHQTLIDIPETLKAIDNPCKHSSKLLNRKSNPSFQKFKCDLAEKQTQTDILALPCISENIIAYAPDQSQQSSSSHSLDFRSDSEAA